MLKVAPSILSADFGSLAKDIGRAKDAGAEWIHVDVMDGCFVPEITIGPLVAKHVRQATDAFMDCHLMVADPDRHVEAFAQAGADCITVHAEACPHLHRNIQQIQALGVKAGVALNPGTPAEAVQHVLDHVDMVLVMTVNPGWGGQAFLPGMVSKVRRIVELARSMEREVPLEIQVDGGINAETARLVERAGATCVVAGSYLYGAQDMRAAVAALRGKQMPLQVE